MSDLLTADLLAKTCQRQRQILQRQHTALKSSTELIELQDTAIKSARAALSAADCGQKACEDLGDAICRLAGERDEARATLERIRDSLRLPAPTSSTEIIRRVLHLAARHQLAEAAR